MRKSLVVVLTFSLIGWTQLVPCHVLAESADTAPADKAPAAESNLKGKILERLEAAPYSYLKLATASGEVWAAVPQTTAGTGTEVTVMGAFPMQEFESKTLKRTFDVVYFGTLSEPAAGTGPAAAHAEPGAMPPGHPPVSNNGGMAAQHQAAAAGPGDVKDLKIAKASGPDARTVAEIHAQRSALNDKTVSVHAQVVKFNAGIMGKNWIHLRDGSGTADQRDNDITVTTQDTVKVGDVVTVTGKVRLDKDFGAGYSYPVIVEEAQVSVAQ